MTTPACMYPDGGACAGYYSLRAERDEYSRRLSLALASLTDLLEIAERTVGTRTCHVTALRAMNTARQILK